MNKSIAQVPGFSRGGHITGEKGKKAQHNRPFSNCAGNWGNSPFECQLSRVVSHDFLCLNKPRKFGDSSRSDI